jgi:PII-like signaling protein
VNGYQISFFTEQSRQHAGKPIGEWLLGIAKEIRVYGATLRCATEGFGRSGRMHSAHFFELCDQPQEVVMSATAAQTDALFARLREAGIKLSYVKFPVEFGTLGESE